MEADQASKAQDLVREFHRELCEVRVLDPACGTGNFLYVSMELMKRLEGEIVEALADLGDTQANLELDRHAVDPHQFLGLEINPRAAAITELVLWIGYLQWHFRTRGTALPAQPVLRNFKNIVEQDAVLAYDGWDVLRDENGRPITRWDGVTHKPHPITGEYVPDEEVRIELRTYLNPRCAEWPEADFIVGNPPFVGNKRMIEELGEGYVEALRAAHKGIPSSVDYVMYWWSRAAALARDSRVRRFGLITTNTITQTFNRRVTNQHLSAKKRPLSLLFCVGDHPWVKSRDRAAVGVALSVGTGGMLEGQCGRVIAEELTDTDAPNVEIQTQWGRITSDFTVGTDVTSVECLLANSGLCWQGCKLVGADFQIETATRDRFLKKHPNLGDRLPRYWAGRDITQRPRRRYVIDFYGLSLLQASEFGAPFQWVRDRVKPARDHVRRKGHREKWWIFGEPRPGMRNSLNGLGRYVVTSEVSKHHVFRFLGWPENLIDGSVIGIASDDAYVLGVLSSRIHEVWALRIGGRMGVGNDPRYQHDLVFTAFPFPSPTDAASARIREVGERLQVHREDVMAAHRHLTVTGIYNVLKKLQGGAALTDAERDVYEAGLVGVLRQIHDDLDEAVAEACGWPTEASDNDILELLVALNRERADEERNGKVRWLRPEFQAPRETAKTRKAEQVEAELIVTEAKAKKPRLPAALPDQVSAVRRMLAEAKQATSAVDLARRFKQGKRVEQKIDDVLRTLAVLGQADRLGDKYVLTD